MREEHAGRHISKEMCRPASQTNQAASSPPSLGRPAPQATTQFGQSGIELPLHLDLHLVSRQTSLGNQSLRNQIHQGRLPFKTVLVGSRRLVRTCDLLAWIDALGSSSSDEGINTLSSTANRSGSVTLTRTR